MLHEADSLPPVISTTPRKWYFLLMLGIHARNILWGMTKCPRMDGTSETLNQGHSKVKGHIGAFSYKNYYTGFFKLL